MTVMDKWTQYAERLRNEMAHAQPTISIERVRLLFGLSTKSHAWYVLKKLEVMGIVRRANHKWYIA